MTVKILLYKKKNLHETILEADTEASITYKKDYFFFLFACF